MCLRLLLSVFKLFSQPESLFNLSLIHISEPTRRYAISYAVFCLKKKEPENPVVYLSNLIKKLDVKNRNGIVALAIVNLLVILLFKFYLKGSGLLS